MGRDSNKSAYAGLTTGKVESYILERIDDVGKLHLTLIDPEKFSPQVAARIAKDAEIAGSSAILVGGSTVSHTSQLDPVIKAIKKSVKIPVILFPGNISGISKFADAILFMSLLNSSNPYFLIGAQALGAPIVKKYGLEPIPLGYIILGQGGAAGIVGYARPIPYDRPELAAMHALAAQFLGMRFVYLEAGSGANEPIPADVVAYVRKVLSIPLIVGGGIRSKAEAERAFTAGADIIVTGTIVEKVSDVRDKLREIIPKSKY